MKTISIIVECILSQSTFHTQIASHTIIFWWNSVWLFALQTWFNHNLNGEKIIITWNARLILCRTHLLRCIELCVIYWKVFVFLTNVLVLLLLLFYWFTSIWLKSNRRISSNQSLQCIQYRFDVIRCCICYVLMVIICG